MKCSQTLNHKSFQSQSLWAQIPLGITPWAVLILRWNTKDTLHPRVLRSLETSDPTYPRLKCKIIMPSA